MKLSRKSVHAIAGCFILSEILFGFTCTLWVAFVSGLPPSKPPIWVAVCGCLAFALLIAVRESATVWNWFLGIISDIDDETIPAKRSWFAFAILTLFVTLLMTPVVYASGIFHPISEYLSRLLPLIGNKVWNGLSSLITTIASGAIGNYAYELIKRALKKK
ncbi:MAG: hypothetical protein WCT12_25370 [Verrucomicrobiota bacterium]